MVICGDRKSSSEYMDMRDRADRIRHKRALAGSLFALAPFLGPVLGPIVGGFVTQALGFRWVFWVNFIFAW